jgi:hypothetical protein
MHGYAAELIHVGGANGVADATLGSSRRGTVPSDAVEIGSGSSNSFLYEPTVGVEHHERRTGLGTPAGQTSHGGGSDDATRPVEGDARAGFNTPTRLRRV